jgi:hypothetical protein
MVWRKDLDLLPIVRSSFSRDKKTLDFLLEGEATNQLNDNLPADDRLIPFQTRATQLRPPAGARTPTHPV